MNYIDELAEAVRAALPAELLPDDPDVRNLCRIYALLILTKRTEITAEDVHDAWATWTAMHDPGHESLKPFAELDAETRREDAPFLQALLAVAARLRDQ